MRIDGTSVQNTEAKKQNSRSANMAESSSFAPKRQFDSSQDEYDGPGPSKTRKTTAENNTDTFYAISQKCQVSNIIYIYRRGS